MHEEMTPGGHPRSCQCGTLSCCFQASTSSSETPLSRLPGSWFDHSLGYRQAGSPTNAGRIRSRCLFLRRRPWCGGAVDRDLAPPRAASATTSQSSRRGKRKCDDIPRGFGSGAVQDERGAGLRGQHPGRSQHRGGYPGGDTRSRTLRRQQSRRSARDEGVRRRHRSRYRSGLHHRQHLGQGNDLVFIHIYYTL